MDTYRSDGPMIRRQPDDMPVVDFDETDNYHTCLQVGLAQLGAEILNLLAEIRDRLPPPAAVVVLLLLAGPAWATVGRDNRDLRPVAEVEEDCDPRCTGDIPPLRGPEPNAPEPFRPAWDSSGPAALRVLATQGPPRSLPIGADPPSMCPRWGPGFYGSVLTALLLCAYVWVRWLGGVLRVRGGEIAWGREWGWWPAGRAHGVIWHRWLLGAVWAALRVRS